MSFRPRALLAALALVASVALLPVAAASGEDTEAVQVACPTLPLWDAAWCWVGVTINLVNRQYQWVTCDVIGGPVCGLDLCYDFGICPVAAE